MNQYRPKNFIIFVCILILQANIVFAGSLKGVIKTRRLRNKSNIVVCLKPKGGLEVKLPPINPMMDQRKLEFLPHILAIPIGATVDFLNNDKVKHNIFSPDNVADKFDFGYYQPGDKRSHTFTKPGSAALLCNKHDEMSSYVYVCESHLFTRTDKKGNYEIKNVPAGDYEVKVWHKKLRPFKKDIAVSGEGMDLDLTLKR